jgi:pyruvate dehydrogenase E1 component alpha subunit
MSVEAVHNAVTEAAARARRGDGPTLLEFRTYRYKGHSMSDPAKYRTKEEVASYKDRDPIEQIKNVILNKKYATEKVLKELDVKLKACVAEAVIFAEESPYPSPSDAYQDVYTENDYPFVLE